MKKKSSKEIVPPRSKAKPFGGRDDEETMEQKTKKKMAARTSRDFSNESLKELRRLKKEYKR